MQQIQYSVQLAENTFFFFCSSRIKSTIYMEVKWGKKRETWVQFQDIVHLKSQHFDIPRRQKIQQVNERFMLHNGHTGGEKSKLERNVLKSMSFLQKVEVTFSSSQNKVPNINKSKKYFFFLNLLVWSRRALFLRDF